MGGGNSKEKTDAFRCACRSSRYPAGGGQPDRRDDDPGSPGVLQSAQPAACRGGRGSGNGVSQARGSVSRGASARFNSPGSQSAQKERPGSAAGDQGRF